MEKQTILFRTPVYENKTGGFSTYEYWGVSYPNSGINKWKPSVSGYSYKDDEQYIGLTDSVKDKVFVGDVLEGSDGQHYVVINLHGGFSIINAQASEDRLYISEPTFLKVAVFLKLKLPI